MSHAHRQCLLVIGLLSTVAVYSESWIHAQEAPSKKFPKQNVAPPGASNPISPPSTDQPWGSPAAKWPLSPSSGFSSPGSKWPDPNNKSWWGSPGSSFEETGLVAFSEIARRQDQLGQLYSDSGRYAEAIERYQKAMDFYSEHAVEQSRYIETSNRLARVYLELGQFAVARNLIEKNIQRLEASEQSNLANPQQNISDPLGDTLALLAEFCRETGDFQQAEKLHPRLIQRRKQFYGEAHREYAVAVHNQGIFEWRRDNFEKAEEILRKELKITESSKADGRELAHSRESLALVLTSLGKFAEAESLFQAALKSLKSLPDVERDRCRTLSNLGFLHIFDGRHAEALELFSDAANVRKALLGDDHLDYADTLADIARLRLVSGKYEEAVSVSRTALAITRKNLELTAAVQSERQQLAMAALFRERLDLLLTAAAKHPEAATNAFEEILAWKGATLVRQRSMRRLSENASIAGHFAKLQDLTMRIASLSRSVPLQSDGVASWKTALQAMTVEKESLEAELSRASAEFRSTKTSPSRQEVASSLPADGVLIDFFQYGMISSDPNKGRFNSLPSLMASVLTPDGAVNAIHLGALNEISKEIDAWRKTFGLSLEAHEIGKRLRQTIWEPLLPLIGDANTILISTDGPLGRLALAALPGRLEGTFLIEDHRLATVPVPQLIPVLLQHDEIRKLDKHLLLLGDVDYGADPDKPKPTDIAMLPWQRRSEVAVRDGVSLFDRLENTSGEIAFIERLYRNQSWSKSDGFVMLDRISATKTRFCELAPKCYQLHLATHGFFAAANVQAAGSTDTRGRMFGDREMTVRGVSPGLLSGLAFTGANRPRQPDQDDGILTADEIAFLPLKGVELVVLSACETGLGEVAGGEGLIGIQRAFQIAGAKTTVASLWKVPDLATRLLMERFYENYWDKKMTRLDSLRDAQLWILNHPDSVRGVIRSQNEERIIRTPPEYWAAFVLSGDWR